MKKFIALMLFVTIVFTLAGCSKGGNSNNGTKGEDASETFTMWLLTGPDSSYYTDYNENPAIIYALSKTFGPDNKKISMDFLLPAKGTELDNLNTMISTGDYPDVMDITRYTDSVKDLYEQGIALDLTPYVEKYMPNYLAFLDAHPEIKSTATYDMDGEQKYLQLLTYSDKQSDLWAGYMYRRDWIVKYGKNPQDGTAFKGEYTKFKEDGSPDVDSWVDNVVFPSGGSDPIYISDWEWMFEIFTEAQKDLGITDSYCMSITYIGALATGDLVSSFGGGGTTWYRTPENKAAFGADSDDFRVYLQAMNNWYQKGWLDQNFAERASDMFYQIDDNNVRQGKVGLWCGVQSMLGGRLDSGDGYLDGIVVSGASNPINDVYGAEAQKNKEPYTLLANGLDGNFYIVTDKAKDKDIATLCSLFDYFYSDEGSLLKTLGLSKEQYEETKDEFYTKQGLTEGAYYTGDDGLLYKTDTLKNDSGDLLTAVAATSIPGLYSNSKLGSNNAESFQHSVDQWVRYKNVGFFLGPIQNGLSVENRGTWNKADTQITEFLSKSLPSLINGSRDINNDADWNAYKKALSKYNPDKVTAILQQLFDKYPIN